MYYKFSFLVFVTIMIIGCDPVQELKINNLSNHDLFISISFGPVFDLKPVEFSEQGDTLWHQMVYLPAKEGTVLPVIGRRGWVGAIKANSTDGSLTTFFFTRELLDSINSENLIKNQMFSKKITLTTDELINMNWEINVNL